MCFRATPHLMGLRVAGRGIGPDPKGQFMTAPVGSWNHDDVEGIQEQRLRAGAEIQSLIADARAGGISIGMLIDGDENPIGLLEDTA